MVSRIKQVSVFIENQPGRLVAMLEALKNNGIDIRAFSISDTADFGIVRMILSDAAKGVEALRQAGFTSRQDWILLLRYPTGPAACCKLLLSHCPKPGSTSNTSISTSRQPPEVHGGHQSRRPRQGREGLKIAVRLGDLSQPVFLRHRLEPLQRALDYPVVHAVGDAEISRSPEAPPRHHQHVVLLYFPDESQIILDG